MARKKSTKESTSPHGYVIFLLALVIGLLINVSASILYDRFLKDNAMAQDVVLGLTAVAFFLLGYMYHSRLHEPLAKFLQEFE